MEDNCLHEEEGRDIRGMQNAIVVLENEVPLAYLPFVKAWRRDGVL